MSIIIQKFGGSSVADTEKLFNVCNHIKRERELGNQVVVVVSAQGKTTDKLLSEAKEICESPSQRELDALASVGEQITIAKLTMCLHKLGIRAVSLTGWQIPIVTTSAYGDADIQRIESSRILKELDSGNVVVVAGFQGIDENNNITTLGRGGSDTTAVALAARLNAEVCNIFTDVDGIFTADPNVVHDAEKLETISYDKMLGLSNLGAKVLHNKCVEIGKKYNVKIVVKSSFIENSQGTLVTD